jgi:hypothetical protein
VSVVDVNCSKKVAADPDSHPRALKCEKSGYGIVTQDKHFLKFDAEGTQGSLKRSMPLTRKTIFAWTSAATYRAIR